MSHASADSRVGVRSESTLCFDARVMDSPGRQADDCHSQIRGEEHGPQACGVSVVARTGGQGKERGEGQWAVNSNDSWVKFCFGQPV